MGAGLCKYCDVRKGQEPDVTIRDTLSTTLPPMNRDIAFLLGNVAFAGALAGMAYVQLDWPGAVVAVVASFLVGRSMRRRK